MLEKLNKTKSILNYLCAVLLIAVLVMQFVPFWTYTTAGETKTASINEFVWLKATDGGITGWFARQVPGFNASTDMNMLVLSPVLMLVLSVVGAVFCMKKSKASLICLLPFACGLIGIAGYLSQPVLQLGELWVVNLGLSIALAAIGLVSLVIGIICIAKGGVVKKERKIIKKLA